MKVPAESLSGPSVRDKVVTAAEAVRLIRDGDAVVVEGFVGQGFAEELTLRTPVAPALPTDEALNLLEMGVTGNRVRQ